MTPSERLNLVHRYVTNDPTLMLQIGWPRNRVVFALLHPIRAFRIWRLHRLFDRNKRP